MLFKEQKIVSANYRDRDSEDKWLLRKKEEDIGKAIEYKTIIASGVVFKDSNKLEFGFGCTVIAQCDKAQGFLAPISVDTKNCVEIKFDGWGSFLDVKTGDSVKKLNYLYLAHDGKIFGSKVPITMTQVPTEEREEVPV